MYPCPLSCFSVKWTFPASGRLSRTGRRSPINTPGSRGCGYKTASGRHEWVNKDPSGELGGINLFCFVINSPTSTIDQFGLSPDDTQTVQSCNITIFVGHNRKNSPHIPKIKNNPCSFASVVACNGVNIPIESPIPGSDPRNDDIINLVAAGKLARSDLAAARKAAAKLCGCKSNCKQTTITINCIGLEIGEKFAMPKGLCGTEEVIDCAKSSNK